MTHEMMLMLPVVFSFLAIPLFIFVPIPRRGDRPTFLTVLTFVWMIMTFLVCALQARAHIEGGGPCWMSIMCGLIWLWNAILRNPWRDNFWTMRGE